MVTRFRTLVARFVSLAASVCFFVGGCAGDGGSSGKVVAPVLGTEAVVTLDPVSPAPAATNGADGGVGAPVSGSGTFRVTRDGVDLMLTFTGCVSAKFYAAHLYDTPDCASALSQVGTGDVAARDGVSRFTCTGTTGYARVAYSRAAGDPKPWTISDAPSSGNLAGKVLVIETGDAPFEALACGKITRKPGPPPPEPVLPHNLAVAELAGFCTWKVLVPTASASCPDVADVIDCAETHCQLSNCLGPCADHLACTARLADPCDIAQGAVTCPLSSECASCEQDIQACLPSFCLQTVSCGTKPTPGGSCDQLEQCCMMQGDHAEACLDTIRLLANLGGDINCDSAMNDWDFNAHLLVPCVWH